MAIETVFLANPSRNATAAYPKASTAKGMDTGAPLKPNPTLPYFGLALPLLLVGQVYVPR